MTLNIEQTEVEHPDVTALKQRVKEVAGRYTSRHGWCGEVKAALREAGIDDVASIKVAITFTMAGSEQQTVEKVYPVDKLAGKSEAEQNAFVAADIAPKVKVAGLDVTLPVTVVDLTQVGDIQRGGAVPTTDPSSGLSYDTERFQHFYTSREGRVAHLVRRDGLDLGEEASARDIDRALRRHRISALCGAGPNIYGNNDPTVSSPRAEGRVCHSCSERAVRA